MANGNVMQPMRGGPDAGDLHYDKHSHMQAGAWEDSCHLLLDYLSASPASSPPRGACTNIADFGCSTGKNSIAAVAQVAARLAARPGRLAADVAAEEEDDVVAFFCDLPTNDFNSLFRSLAAAAPPYRAAGVAGSFYERMLPRNSLHVGICNISLHWTSQVPPEVAQGAQEGPSSPFWNPDTLWLASCTNENVIEAYRRQAAEDLRSFLTHRAAELAPGGVLWFLVPARTDPDPAMRNVPGNMSPKYVMLILHAWWDLVRDGHLAQASLDTFNFPLYHRSAQEIRDCVQELEGMPLRVHCLEEMTPVSPPGVEYRAMGDAAVFAKRAIALSRVVMEPMVAEHIGWESSELLFARAERNVAASPEKYLQSKDYRYLAAVLVKENVQ